MERFVLPALLALTAPASAQQVVFHDGFESGLSNWTATGLWNLEDSGDPCGSQAAPFAEGTKSAWYGVEGACDYRTTGTANHGDLALNVWVDLPQAASISLRFWMWSHTEYCGGVGGESQYDVHTVRVEAQNGPDAGFTQRLCPIDGTAEILLPWHERRIDLSAYRGARVRIAFGFDAVDTEYNGELGWLVDHVSILAEPGERVCPSAGFNSGCPCMPTYVPVAGGCRNSTGQSATLLSQGVISVAQDTLSFTAAHMPPGTSPTLFQGTTQVAPAVFGDGLRCIGGTQLRLGTHVAPAGSSSWPAPGSTPLSRIGQVPTAGGTRSYQVIYRNAGDFCTPNTFNLTDAQRIVWVP